MEFKRRYLRLADCLKCKYRYKVIEKYTEGKGVIFDISGGGVMLVSQTNIPKGKKIKIDFDKPLGPLTLSGEVIRSKVEWYVSDKNKEMHWTIHIKFADISAEDRKKVIQYVYKCATERRKARINKWGRRNK